MNNISASYLCVDSLPGFKTLLQNSDVSHLTVSGAGGTSEEKAFDKDDEESGSENAEQSDGVL